MYTTSVTNSPYSVKVPPIKSQGIKTKLVPWIKNFIPDGFHGRWVEPFMGTGVVGFNLANKFATLCDSNPHLIKFYNSVSSGEISPSSVRSYLEKEGKNLLDKGEGHYYYIRDRFNSDRNPLDFLFLSRAGFNGMMRFNRKGEFNIPFCRKPERFSKSYITKIVNQVAWVSSVVQSGDYRFVCQDFDKTLKMVDPPDIVYCDPPYIGRHSDYFNTWNCANENNLFELLYSLDCKFILSTWHHNDYRSNELIEAMWSKFNVYTRDHFYHVGGKVRNRGSMVEALITNIPFSG